MTECARNYTTPQGRLYSKVSSDCELYISLPENYTISLYFTSLEFHLTEECSPDNTPLKVKFGHFSLKFISFLIFSINGFI